MNQEYRPPLSSFSTHLYYLSWSLFGQIIFRLIPLPFFSIRVLLLRLYGASIGNSVKIYPSVNIYLPKNLVLGDYVGIGPHAVLYSQGIIKISNYSIISQNTYLCTASHNYNRTSFDLVVKQIDIEDNCWIAAYASILPGVRLSQGCVLGAHSVLSSKITIPWTIYAGNPATRIKTRTNFVNSLI